MCSLQSEQSLEMVYALKILMAFFNSVPVGQLCTYTPPSSQKKSENYF